MIDVVLFELEGVCFETRDLRRDCLRAALDAHIADTAGLAFDTDLVDGQPPRAAIAALFAAADVGADDVLIDLIAADAERRFSSAIAAGGAIMAPGARDFIQRVAPRVRLGVVTRLPRTDAHALLHLAGMVSEPTLVVCADDVLDAKPSPECYLEAVRRLERARLGGRSGAIALEDGAPGIRAARAAGIRCIAVGPLAPHAAMDANGYVESLDGQTIASLEGVATNGRGRENVQ